MGFLNVLGDIAKNRSNFKAWEKEEQDKDAKRKALYEANPVSSDVLAEKQKLANTIIDTITIMDQHSEDVSEDIETLTQPITGISMLAGFIGAAIPGFKFLDKKFKEKNKAMRAVEAGISSELIEKVASANKLIKNKYYICRQILESGNHNKLVIPDEVQEQVNRFRAEVVKINKPFKKYPFIVLGSIIASGIGTFLASVLITTKMQVGSSRVARFQARKDLEDPKNFVVYTDEQIKQAKENLKNKPEEKKSFWSKLSGKDDEKTGLLASINNVKGLLVDKKAYLEWKKANAKKDNRVMRDLTPEELDEAKRDKEVIQRLTKKINNKAEEYSTNMETAAGVILGSSLLGGPIIGGAVSWVLNLLGVGDKISATLIKKMTNESTLNIYNKLKQLNPDSLEYKKLRKAFNEAVFVAIYPESAAYRTVSKELDQCRNELDAALGKENYDELRKKYNIKLKEYDIALDKYISQRKTQYEEVKSRIKSILSHALSTKAGRNRVLAIASGAVSTIIGTIVALKLQKQASRAGRYMAKEEFRNNPQEFIAYTDEEMEQVRDVKAQEQTLGQKFKEYMMFLPTVFKQHREYMNYKKGDYKKEKALREELVKLEVTPEQLREGKNLQRKLFNTFEKIDDKSQEYSENMEATSEIVMQFSMLGGLAACCAPFILTAAAVASGKTSLSKISLRVTEFLSRFSFIANSKFFKNYVSDVAKNIETEVVNAHPARYEIDSLNDNLKDLVESIKALKNTQKGKNVLALLNTDMSSFFKLLQNTLSGGASIVIKGMKHLDEKTLNSLSEKLKNATVGNILNMMQALSKSSLNELSDPVVAKSVIKASGLDFNEKEADILLALFRNVIRGTEQADKLLNVIGQLIKTNGLNNKNSKLIEDLLNNVPMLNMDEILAGKYNMQKQLNAILQNISSEGIPKELASQKFLSDSQFVVYQNYIKRILENKEQILQAAKTLERVAKNIPISELSTSVSKIVNIAIEKPQEFVLLIKSPDKLKSMLMTPQLKRVLAAAGISWGVFVTAVMFAVQSYFAKLQKEAGRLGVMKAMEELQDDRIYADIEAKQTESKDKGQAGVNSNLPDNIKKLLNH